MNIFYHKINIPGHFLKSRGQVLVVVVSPRNKVWPWPAKISSFFSAQPVAELPPGYWCSAPFVQSLSSAKETSVGKCGALCSVSCMQALLDVCHL